MITNPHSRIVGLRVTLKRHQMHYNAYMFVLRCDRLRQSFFMDQNYDIYGSFKTASIQHDMAKVQKGTVPVFWQHKYDSKCTIPILGLCLLQGTKKWRNDSKTRKEPDI